MKYITNENIEPSFAEVKIIQQLRKANVHFVREVSFLALKNPETGALLRYDFYIPEYNMLIEYDGIKSHASDGAKYRDKIKNEFADLHKIRLIRISGIRFIDVFFKSDIWTNQVKTDSVHKPKRKRLFKPKVKGETPFVKIDYILPIKPKQIEPTVSKKRLKQIEMPNFMRPKGMTKHPPNY